MEIIDTKLSESREEREKRFLERYKEDIREMLKTAGGRRLYWAWMSFTGQFREQFVQGMQDQTFYNLGRASVGRDLLNDLLSADPSRYAQMQQEYASERASYEALDRKLQGLNT